MCPEVIFTPGAVQVNYYKDTACEVHKKLSLVFSHHPGGETSFVAALKHSHDEKMVNMLQTDNISLLFPKPCQGGRSVLVWSGVPRDGDGTPGGDRGSWGCKDGPPMPLRVAWGSLAAYANDFMTKVYNSVLTFANISMSSWQCYTCDRQIGKNPNPMGFGSC